MALRLLKLPILVLKSVFYIADGLFSPLGKDATLAFEKVMLQESAVVQQQDSAIAQQPFFGAVLQEEQTEWLDHHYPQPNFSRFEAMSIAAVEEALSATSIDIRSKDCIIILSATKGNIEWLGQEHEARIRLSTSATIIQQYFQNPNTPLVVSTACISGTLALITAKRLLEAGLYREAVVVGADRLSGFVLSGFQSFQAVAPERCKPFDKNRKGINLGEAAACIILSTNRTASIKLAGGAVSNDANHLSGPSRSGAELAGAIENAMQEAGLKPSDIDMIAAHGTATIYNDDMEAKALHLAGLSSVPLHSLKAYTGHTLGAAGVLESIMACRAMQANQLIVSLGFGEAGVPVPLNVTAQPEGKDIQAVLKTASGFGGCNAALAWVKM